MWSTNVLKVESRSVKMLRIIPVKFSWLFITFQELDLLQTDKSRGYIMPCRFECVVNLLY